MMTLGGLQTSVFVVVSRISLVTLLCIFLLNRPIFRFFKILHWCIKR